MTELRVHLHRSLDVPAWRAEHARGERPDATPYGLHKLAELGYDVLFAPQRRSTPAELMMAAASRAPGGSPERIALSWDEFTAVHMAGQERGSRRATGVIWAVDMLASKDVRIRARLAYLRRVLRGFDLVWCLSEAQVAPLRAWLGAEGPMVRALRFGVDTDFFSKAPLDSSATVLSVGNDRDRDTVTLVRGLELLKAHVPELEVRIQTRHEVELPSDFVRLPWMSHTELRAEIERATVMVLATRPNLHVSGMTASLEAMSVGRPVVLTNTPGADQYVVPGLHGELATVTDPQSLFASVLHVLNSDPVAYGDRARSAVETGMTSTHMVRQLGDFLSDAIQYA
ncbi:glycosyltransferase family 4 protein [Agromyces aerolatus]|uniref:glycosyltransferase family 4 protein n=1 Tax=Agromyces sp. LY-1074 TaxID=3074080 RepID=UPI00286099E8|nr:MULTISPECIES: glycosyltransferase family 4 protein [unclassified Agromyces]MDR5701480.1 glycosyltransferase family 4 protein [Agromyces sp. LY-1074]MDR5704453.1 glycosyltransferase family 4 protein [Agromyces sp. LY-1358]